MTEPRATEYRSQESVNEEYSRLIEHLVDCVARGEYNFADYKYNEETTGGYDILARSYDNGGEAHFLTTLDVKFRLVSTGKA